MALIYFQVHYPQFLKFRSCLVNKGMERARNDVRRIQDPPRGILPAVCLKCARKTREVHLEQPISLSEFEPLDSPIRLSTAAFRTSSESAWRRPSVRFVKDWGLLRPLDILVHNYNLVLPLPLRLIARGPSYFISLTAKIQDIS